MRYIMIASIVSGILNLIAYRMMKSDPWRYTKLSGSIVSFVIFVLSLNVVLNGPEPVFNCYSIVAIILIFEQLITSTGQIIRQVDLKRRRKCLIFMSRRAPA